MGAFKDIWESERGVIAVAVLIAVTVLAIMGVATYDQWADFTKFVLVTYTASKTITGSAQILKGQAATTSPTNPTTPS